MAIMASREIPAFGKSIEMFSDNMSQCDFERPVNTDIRMCVLECICIWTSDWLGSSTFLPRENRQACIWEDSIGFSIKILFGKQIKIMQDCFDTVLDVWYSVVGHSNSNIEKISVENSKTINRNLNLFAVLNKAKKYNRFPGRHLRFLVLKLFSAHTEFFVSV